MTRLAKSLFASFWLCLVLAPAPLLGQASTKQATSETSVVPARAENSASTKVAIPTGTRLIFLVSEAISSRTAKRGDRIKMTLKDDLLIDDTLILTAGTAAIGEVTDARKKGFMGRGGRLNARMLYLDLADGPVRLSGPLASSGKDQTGLATAATAITLGTTFFITGKSAQIPEGAELVVRLDREARVPVSQ